MIDILEYILTSGSTMSIALFVILALYLLIKISKDVIRWVQEWFDRKNKNITDGLTRCHTEGERITRLEEQYKSNEKSITQILSQIQEINQKLDTFAGLL